MLLSANLGSVPSASSVDSCASVVLEQFETACGPNLSPSLEADASSKAHDLFGNLLEAAELIPAASELTAADAAVREASSSSLTAPRRVGLHGLPPPTFTGIVATAPSGTPIDPLLPSANVRSPITINGSGFSLATDVVFPTIASVNGVQGSENVRPRWVAPDGTSLVVVVPDAARTGNVGVAGAAGIAFLQVVPTVSDIDLTAANFATGSSFIVYGSGFTEDNLIVRFGSTEVVDTGVSSGADVQNHYNLGAGADRSENEAISLQVPAGASPGLITVETAGGVSAALPIGVTQIVANSLAGIAASSTQPAANPGQTIRVFGSGLDLTTDVVFPTIDAAGSFSNTVVLPDIVNADRTMMEIRVPQNATTGNVRVIGASGSFLLQVVPTLSRVVRAGASGVQVYGSGFSENNGLSVSYGGVVVSDAGANLDVVDWFVTSGNDYLSGTLPVGWGPVVSVTTAGGTSNAVSVAVDQPGTMTLLRDLAIYPAGAGADAGRMVVTDGTVMQVYEAGSLTLVRSLARPGAVTSQIGMDFLGESLVVAGVNVPAGSLMVVNAAEHPDRLYYMAVSGGGVVLASVPLAGLPLVDEAGAVGVVYHGVRHTLFVMRVNTDLVTEIDPVTGGAIKSFHTGFSVGDGDLEVEGGTGMLLVGGSGRRLVRLDPESGRVVGSYDRIGNDQFGTIDLSRQGLDFQPYSASETTGLAYDNAGVLWAGTSAGRVIPLTLPGAPVWLQVGGVMAVAIDGVPADPLKPSANASQRIRIVGSGYNRFTEVEFPRVPSSGEPGYVRVRVDVVSADGTTIEVVVPQEAVTGKVKISGAPGDGLFLQVTPTIRSVLPADGNFNYDVPVDGMRWGLVGSGLVEGGTRVRFGGIEMEDNSWGTDLDVYASNATGFSRQNGRLDLTVPERALAGPVRVETAGGWFEVGTVPVRSQPSVGLSEIVALAGEGVAANGAVASANAGQLITLNGFGFTTETNVIFKGVTEEGVRGEIVARPSSVPNTGQLTVVVPVLAVSGLVTVAGSGTSVMLQVVPTLRGISVGGGLVPGMAIRLSGSGIPEGGSGLGEGVTYGFGAGAVVDINGVLGPDVFSALAQVVEVSMVVPATASGNVVTVTTAGGTATLALGDVVVGSVVTETQGGGVDGVGQTLASAVGVSVGPNSQTAVSGRIHTANDVDVYRLDGAVSGGILSVSVSGAQGGNAYVKLFDETGALLTGVYGGTISRYELPVRGGYYLGYSGWSNVNYNVVDGSGAANSSAPGDYTITLRYSDPGATSLNGLTAVASSGVPAEATVASANTGQSITVTGEGFTSGTRVKFTTFDGLYPSNGLGEQEVTPLSVAADGLSFVVGVPAYAVTGVVRVSDEGSGLILQVVPTLVDVTVSGTAYGEGVTMSLVGSGYVEGAQRLILGTAIGSGGSVEVRDHWDADGPDVTQLYSPTRPNAGMSVVLPRNPPTGPVKVQTLGGTSAPFVVSLTGIAAGTVADRGTPANGALPSANVREPITLLGSQFDLTTQVVFPLQESTYGNSDVRWTRWVTPSQVSADGTSLQVVVPDDAATGLVYIVGVEDGLFLQIVPTIIQILIPSSFATGQGLTVQGSGFIEDDLVVGVGSTYVQDTGPFHGPDANNPSITFAGKDRADNDGISLAVPPGGAAGPWFVTTAGGTAKLGIVIDLGVVIREARPGRTVGASEQELFKATASVTGWLDFDVHFTANNADLIVLNFDGTPATLIEFTTVGSDVHLRVATDVNATGLGKIFFLQVNGLSTFASYDLVATNHDRFDDPLGPQQGAFSGHYGSDPDGPNDLATASTDFSPASYVNEVKLSVPRGDGDWLTWKAQATGMMSVGVLFTATNGTLSFRVYSDANDNGILDGIELASPVATALPVVDGARVNGISVPAGRRLWAEIFGIDGNTDGIIDQNLYTLTFSNYDLIDSGMLAGHIPPNNDTQTNAVNLGADVAWNSKSFSDFLTIHEPADADWFLLTTLVPGTLQVLVDLPHPLIGKVEVIAVHKTSGIPLSQFDFQDLGSRLRFNFASVAKNEEILLKLSGQANAYVFSVQNQDLSEPNPTLAQPANLGLVINQRLLDRSLPGLPDPGTRDEDWFKLVTQATSGRIDVAAAPDPLTPGDLTIRVWKDVNGNGIPEQALGELLAEATSSGGTGVSVSAPAENLEELFVQVIDPNSGPFTGIAYSIVFKDIDRFDKFQADGTTNETAASATNLGAIVHATESGLTLLPSEQDWFKATMRAASGTLDVVATAQPDFIVVRVYRDTNNDNIPDTLAGTGTGNSIRITDLVASMGEMFWVETVLVDAGNLDAAGSLVQLEIKNPDRFDDPFADGTGGTVLNPTGFDPDGTNDGPRSSGTVIEGTLRLVQPNPAIAATWQGHVGVSTDGLGTFTTGQLQVQLPAGSTIELALLYVATRARNSSTPYRPSQIGFGGTTVPLTYLSNVDNGAAGVDFETGRSDVTTLVSSAIGAAGGLFHFEVDERIANAGLNALGQDQNLDLGIEGTALVVIYSNPSLPIRSVAVLEGGLSGPAPLTASVSLSTPVNKADPDFIATVGLGISFGYQPDGQYSTVTVNGTRLTSSAGNFDDGISGDGALITVGGLGDSLTNPPDRFDSADTSDDELYDLAPFLLNGDTQIRLQTANPSDDDSIFLAIITVSGEAGVAALFTDLGVVGHASEADLTLSQGDEDWFRIEAGSPGDLVTTLDFESDGSALALLYRDIDLDGLPDDLNADGSADPVGIIVSAPGHIRISNVPGIQTDDVFLLRVFSASGQVEYDLDVRINQAPVALSDTYSTPEETALVVAAPGVLANDTDVDGNPLTALLVTGPAHGTLTLNASGSLSYTPDANFNGTDSFTYKASDGTTDSNVATVTITVGGVNDAPSAVPDAYTTDEDSTLSVPGPGVLANDTDVDGNPLTAVLVTGPAHGTLTLNADGSLSYTPNANFNGTDSFTYKASDGTTDSNVATVTVNVTPLVVHPDLVLTKTGPLGSVVTGSEITYLLTFRNTGEVAASEVIIVDTLPLGVVFVSASAGGVYQAGLHEVVFLLGTVAADDGVAGGSDEGVLTVIVKVTATSGSITNLAHITTSTGESDVSNNFSQTTNAVQITTIEGTPGKITGGGSVDERIRNFGFVVQTKVQQGQMSFTGQVEFQDKDQNYNLHSETITLIRVEPDGIHGLFMGTATLNGVPGYQFRVDVEDNGEPGALVDRFRMRITGPGGFGYDSHAYATLGGLLDKGGNIQVHTAPPADLDTPENAGGSTLRKGDAPAVPIDLGPLISWESGVIGDALTIDTPEDEVWFRFASAGDGVLRVLLNVVQPEAGRVHLGAFDAVRGAGLPIVDQALSTGLLRVDLGPVRAGQSILLQLTGAPVSYSFSLNIVDRFDDSYGDGHGGAVMPGGGLDWDGPNDGTPMAGGSLTGSLTLVRMSPNAAVSIEGHVAVSVDGLGTFDTGLVQALIPNGAKIEQAWLYVATRSTTSAYRPAAIGFEGAAVPLTYLANVGDAAGLNFETGKADVTQIVSKKPGNAGGTLNFSVDERVANAGLKSGSDRNSKIAVEGTALVVVYSHPALPERSLAVFEGGVTGSEFGFIDGMLVTPSRTTEPGQQYQLQLGIANGNNATSFNRTVTVNGVSLTAATGGVDDGQDRDGARLTVGGLGDDSRNPSDPAAANAADDESYDLTAFSRMDGGSFRIETAASGPGDLVFLAVVSAPPSTAFAIPLTDFGRITNAAAAPLTLHSGDVDWFRFNPASKGELQIAIGWKDGAAGLAELYRDQDGNGLPDDLDGDGRVDPVATAKPISGAASTLNLDSVTESEAFLLRLVAPVGGVAYNLNVVAGNAP